MRCHIIGYYEDTLYLFVVYTLCFVKYIAICKLSPLHGGGLMRTPSEHLHAGGTSNAEQHKRDILYRLFALLPRPSLRIVHFIGDLLP